MVELGSIEGYPEKVEGCYSRGSHFVYVLRLFGDRWYIGVTDKPKRRVISHARGEATSHDFVKTYPPVGVESVIGFDSRQAAMEREREIAGAFAHYHGENQVRGGRL
jgi:predicted GIY-YIG superfamily endonuclease